MSAWCRNNAAGECGLRDRVRERLHASGGGALRLLAGGDGDGRQRLSAGQINVTSPEPEGAGASADARWTRRAWTGGQAQRLRRATATSTTPTRSRAPPCSPTVVLSPATRVTTDEATRPRGLGSSTVTQPSSLKDGPKPEYTCTSRFTEEAVYSDPVFHRLRARLFRSYRARLGPGPRGPLRRGCSLRFLLVACGPALVQCTVGKFAASAFP
eukprot:766475-Hanusia_phi.AAC.3